MKHINGQNDVSGFKQVDQTFDSLKFTETKKMAIYQRLAVILHLGEIGFEDTFDMQTRIIESSEKHVILAAKLLKLSSEELKNALLYNIISVAGTDIM